MMPALYALAQHDALAAAASQLEEGERIFAFLDDLYVVTTRDGARSAFETVAGEVETRAGVRSHLGKLRAWCRSPAPRPASFDDLGAEVWVADAPPELNGIQVLGTPLGSEEYVAAQAAARLADERKYLDAICTIDDVQGA